MLGLEVLEDRCLPSAFIAVDGLPNSRTGFAPAPGKPATVTVYFRDLTGPAASATRAALASLDRQFRQGHVGVNLVAVNAVNQANVVILRGPGGGSEGGATYFPLAFADGLFNDGHPYFHWRGRVRIVISSTTPYYYGAAPRPPATQADFETVVMHELGHSLGLDHNNTRDDPANSDGFDTMNAVLPTGQVRRVYSGPDLAALQRIYGTGTPR